MNFLNHEMNFIIIYMNIDNDSKFSDAEPEKPEDLFELYHSEGALDFDGIDPDIISHVPEYLRIMKKAERKPRYEPFRNRTPLVCQDEEAALFENGIGTICHPCGLRCEGKFFVVNFELTFTRISKYLTVNS